MPSLEELLAYDVDAPPEPVPEPEPVASSAPEVTAVAATAPPPPRVPTVGEKAIQAQSAAAAPLGMQGAMMTPPKQRSPLEELLGADSAEEAEQQMIDNPEFDEFDYYAKYKESDPNAKAFMLRTNEERAARGFKTPDGKDYPHYKDPSMTVGDAFEGAADFMFGVPEQFYNVVEQRVLEHKGHPNAQRAAAQYTLGGQTMGKSLDALVEKTPFAPAKPQVYGEYVMKTPRGYLLGSESKPIPAKIAQWEAALPTVAERIKYAEERGGATGEEFGEVINGKAGLLRNGFAKLKAGNPNLTPEENEQLKVLAIEVEKEDAAKAKASYEKALRQQKAEAKGEDVWERRQLANAIPLDTGTIAENYKARYGILPSRDLGPAALKQAGADPVDEGVVRRMAAVGDPMNLGFTYLRAPLSVPGARTTGGALARGVGYLGEKTAALAEKALKSKVVAGSSLYGLMNLFGNEDAARDTGLAMLGTWGIKKLGVAAKALNEYGKEVMTGGKYIAPLTSKVAKRAADTASDPWFVRKAKNAGGALKMKGLEAFVQAAGAPVGMSGLNLLFSGGDPQTFGALSLAAPMWGLWGFHGGVKPQLVNAMRPHMQAGGKAHIDAQRAATNDPWSHKSAEFIETLPEEQRNRTYEMVDAFVGRKTKAENGQEGVSDLLVLPANEYAAYKAEHNLPAGPERAITMHNGKAIVNGEHYSLLGKEGESNYRHTLGHEVGTHVPMAIARAMTGPGSPLHTNIINGLKKELMPGGKPRPDYLAFVDHYNREAAKSGEPPKSPEEMIEEYMAGTSGRFFEMKSAADLVIPDGISESVQKVLDSNFGTMIGLDPREVGGTGYFDHKERGRATALVTDFMRQIVSPETRATQGVDPSTMAPVPPKPAPGSVKPPGWQAPAPGGPIPATPPIVPHVPTAPGAAAPVGSAPARALAGPEAVPVPANAQRWAQQEPAAALQGLQLAQPQPAGRAALQLSGEKPSGAPEGGGAPENAPNAPESSPSAGNQPSGGAARVQIAPEPGAEPAVRRAPAVTMPKYDDDDRAADQLIRASKNRTQAALDIAHQAAQASGNDALFQRRVDPYTGAVSFKGRIDLNRPEHRALIRQLKLTPKELSHLMVAQDAFTGQERYVDYWSASKEKTAEGEPTTDITGAQRRREYINDKGKKVRELLQENKGIVFMGLEVDPTTGNVLHRGLSTDKLVANIAKLIGAAKDAGIPIDFTDINDPQIRKTVENILQNYDNGYTADGSQLFKREKLDANKKPVKDADGNQVWEDIPAKSNSVPIAVPRGQADLINTALHFDITRKPWEHAQKKAANEQARAEQNFDERKAAGLLDPNEKKIRKTKKNVAPQVATKAKESQAYAALHGREGDVETGDVNRFRALVNESGQLTHVNEKGEVRKGTSENLESVWEDLRPDYIEDMRMEPSAAPRTVRDVGLKPETRTGEFLPDASRINWRALPANLMPTGGEPAAVGKKGALREEVITPERIQAVVNEANRLHGLAAERTKDHSHLSTVISRALFPFIGTRVRGSLVREFEPWKKAMADVVASLPEGASDFSNVQKAFPGGTKMDIATAVRRAHDIARTAFARTYSGEARRPDSSSVSRDYLNMLEILQTDFSSPIPYSAVRELERITYPREEPEDLPEPKAVLRRPRPPKVTGEGSEEVEAYLPHETGALEGGGKFGKWQTQEAMDAAKAALPEHYFSNKGDGHREGEINIHLPDGENVGYIQWTRQSDGDIHLDSSHLASRSKSGKDLRGTGLGEALYREMARQVQKLGGEKLISGITSEAAMRARRRLFETPAERFVPDRRPDLSRGKPDHYYGDIYSEIHPDVHYMPTGGDPALSPRERKANLKKWLGGAKVYRMQDDAHEIRPGKPVVFEGVHGTTHDFDVVDPRRGNIENDMGKGYYVSNTHEDVGSNYAGEGPDLTSRIERRAEQLEHDVSQMEKDEIVDTFNLSDEDAQLLHDSDGYSYNSPQAKRRNEILQDLARKELKGHGGATQKVFVKMENPLVIGRGEEHWDTEYHMDERGDEDGPPTGKMVEFIDALRRVGRNYYDAEFEGRMESQKLEDLMLDGAPVSEVIKAAKEALSSATDENGNHASGEIVREALERMGYDGIIDKTVNEKFGSQKRGFLGQGRAPGMAGMHPDTVHAIAFEGGGKVKSATGNVGTYDPAQPSMNLMPTGGEPTEPGKKGALRGGVIGAGALEAERKKGALRGAVRGMIDELKKPALALEDWPEEVRKGALAESKGLRQEKKGATVEPDEGQARDYGEHVIAHPGDDVSMPIRQALVDGKPKMLGSKPVYIAEGYGLVDAPAIKNHKGAGPEDPTKIDFDKLAYDVTGPQRAKIDAAIENGSVDALANEMVKRTKEALKNKDVADGSGWYSRMREHLLRELGPEGRELLAQLLGATSAKTPVNDNFLQAMDAFEKINNGDYKRNRKLYEEMMKHEEGGTLNKLIAKRGYADMLIDKAAAAEVEAESKTGQKREEVLRYAARLKRLAAKPEAERNGEDSRTIMEEATDMMPTRSSGAKFNANSQAVMKVIADRWVQNRESPKTPNFAGNLSGRTVQATIDVWAARFLRQLMYEGHTKDPWRIQPKSETGVNNQDFAIGQEIFKRAAKKLEMNPDDLQAILWFSEKHNWDARGWTSKVGAKKASFDDMFHMFFPKGKPRLTFAKADAEFKRINAEKKAAEEAELRAEAARRGIGITAMRKIRSEEKKAAKAEEADEDEAD